MSASTSSAAATYRTTSPMNPTTTQHDFRFPRRPGPQPAHGYGYGYDFLVASPPPHNPSGPELRTNLEDLSLDTSSSYAAAHDALQASEPFPPLKQDLASEFHSFDQLPQEDPLAIRVWKFYAQTKLMLPDQRRMENLTWRMMHGTLMKRRNLEEAQANNRYAAYFPVCARRTFSSCDFFPPNIAKVPSVTAF